MNFVDCEKSQLIYDAVAAADKVIAKIITLNLKNLLPGIVDRTHLIQLLTLEHLMY